MINDGEDIGYRTVVIWATPGLAWLLAKRYIKEKVNQTMTKPSHCICLTFDTPNSADAAAAVFIQ